MQVIAGLLFIIYNIFCFMHFSSRFPVKRRSWVDYVLIIALNIACCYVVDLLNLHRAGIFILMASFMLELKMFIRMDTLRILHGGSSYILIIYSCRGIIAAIYSIALKQSVNDVLETDNYYYVIISLAVLLAIGFLMLVKTVIAPDKKLKYLYPDAREMKAIIAYHYAILIYVLLLNDGRFFEANTLWFSTHYLASFLLILGLLGVIWRTTIRVAALLEYELHTRRLQEQLDRQVSHYNSYKKFTESYRIFKHDYEQMIATVKSLINNKENEKAARLIDSIHDTMQKSIQMHKTYSDNVLLDAILQEAANTCEEHQISFTAILHCPDVKELNDLEIIRIFNNTLNNAIEACDKVSEAAARFITVRGDVNAEWTFIEIANSFSEKLKYRDGELVTTKSDADYHGYGLLIIRKIVEDMGGLVLVEVNQKDKVFTLKLHIPRNS